MSVYVDNWRAVFGNMLMSHMMADTREELLAMATTIGVKHKWLQAEGTWREHFDVCLTKRILAIQNGAIAMDARTLVRLMIQKKGSPSLQAITGVKSK